MSKEWTTIRVRRTTAQKLKSLGKMGESYDDVINRLIKEHEDVERARLKNTVTSP